MKTFARRYGPAALAAALAAAAAPAVPAQAAPPARSAGDAVCVDGAKRTGCAPHGLLVTATSAPATTKTTSWTIDKSVDVPSWNLFRGDSATSVYRVDVTRSRRIAWTVSGTVTVKNPLPHPVAVAAVAVTVGGVAGQAAVACPGGLPATLPPKAALTCSYGPVTLPDGQSRIVTATVAWSHMGMQHSADDTAPVSFAGVAPAYTGPGLVRVEDPVLGRAAWFTASGSVSYPRVFRCDRDAGATLNTATLYAGKGSTVIGSDSAQVTVACNALLVTKTAAVTVEREHTWTIAKSASPVSVADVPAGATVPVAYTVVVTPTAADVNPAVGGEVTVRSPAGAPPVKVLSVTDVLSGTTGTVALDCGDVTFPVTLAAGETLRCTYSRPLPDLTDRVNTATATIENRVQPPKAGAAAGTTAFTGSADVTPGTATPRALVDESVTVTDGPALNAVATAGVSGTPIPFAFTRAVGPVACGASAVVPNTATFTTIDRGRTGSASAAVTLTGAPCAVPPAPGGVLGTEGAPPPARRLAPALRVTKSGPRAATAGRLVTYRITVRNTGRVATGLVVRDRVPSGYVLARRSTGARLSGGAVTWRVARLAPGAVRTVTATFRIRRDLAGRRCNTATASAPGAPTVRATACTRIGAVAGAVEPAVTG